MRAALGCVRLRVGSSFLPRERETEVDLLEVEMFAPDPEGGGEWWEVL